MNDEVHIEQLTAVQWREDLGYMAREMEARHKDLYHSISREQFLEAVGRLHEAIPGLARHQIIVELARIVAMVGDAHTMLYLRFFDPAVQFRFYPLRLNMLQGVLFVRAASLEYRYLLGAAVEQVGALSVAEALELVRPLISADNEMRALVWGPDLLLTPEVLHAIGATNSLNSLDELPFTFNLDGNPVMPALTALEADARVEWVDANTLSDHPKPLWLKDLGNAFWFEYLADYRTIYLQFNAVRDKPDETLAAFFGRVFEFVDGHEVEKFVIDLRHNGGGDNRPNWPLIYGLICREKVNRQGRLFAIVGRETFSAAMNCVSALEQHTQVLFVGEPTGSSPNHYGDAVPVQLPNSGITVHVSSLYWQDSMPYDNRPYVEPHIKAELAREDYLSNRDPAMEAILRYEG